MLLNTCFWRKFSFRALCLGNNSYVWFCVRKFVPSWKREVQIILSSGTWRRVLSPLLPRPFSRSVTILPCICVCNDAVSSSDYAAWYDGRIHQHWITNTMQSCHDLISDNILQFILTELKIFTCFVLTVKIIRCTHSTAVVYCRLRRTRWRSCLRHGAISRKVAGSISDGITGIFHWLNPSSHTMTSASTQPLTEMSTRNISGGGGGG
jgi:hypothetical protein